MSPKRCLRARLLVGLMALVVALLPAIALGHPLGNFTINRYSRLEPGGGVIKVFHVLDIAEIPSVQEQQAADTDHDGTVSDAEWAVWKGRKVDELRQGLELTVDGRLTELSLEQASVSISPGQANLPLTRLEATFQAAVSGGQHSVMFRDRNDPNRIGWREVVVRAASGATLSQSSASADSTSNELRSYPDGLLQSPLDQRQATFQFTAAAGAGSITPSLPLPFASATLDASGRAVDPFTALITAADLNPGVVLLAILAAAFLGGIHGASPGHGKTVMAAYIVGTRGTFLHALALAGSVTFSHTFGVLVLGMIVLAASNTIVPERLYPWLTLVSGLIVVLIGGGLIVRALFGSRRSTPPGHLHDDGHVHDHEHEHGSHGHRHDLPITWRNLFALGLAGGIVPSASALVVLLSALALGRLGFGLLLIVAFGAGMGIVLTATGFLMVYAGHFVARLVPQTGSRLQQRLTQAVPLISALVMTGAGAVVTIQGLGQFGYLPIG